MRRGGNMRLPFLAISALLLLSPRVRAQAIVDTYLEQNHRRWEETSQKLWEMRETALQEKKSSALLEDTLAQEGFQVQRGVGQLPTAFVATAGSGSPVVAIL